MTLSVFAMRAFMCWRTKWCESRAPLKCSHPAPEAQTKWTALEGLVLDAEELCLGTRSISGIFLHHKYRAQLWDKIRQYKRGLGGRGPFFNRVGPRGAIYGMKPCRQEMNDFLLQRWSDGR